MGRPLESLEAEAMELPADERAHLAHRLLISLEEDAGDDPLEVERAWEEELRRRWASVENGTARLIDAEDVFAEFRDRRST